MLVGSQVQFKTYNIRLDWKFPITSFDQHSQPDTVWPSIGEYLIERCSDRTPGLQYIVH